MKYVAMVVASRMDLKHPAHVCCRYDLGRRPGSGVPAGIETSAGQSRGQRNSKVAMVAASRLGLRLSGMPVSDVPSVVVLALASR